MCDECTLAPQNIPRAISALTLGNKVVLYVLIEWGAGGGGGGLWGACIWIFNFLLATQRQSQDERDRELHEKGRENV